MGTRALINSGTPNGTTTFSDINALMASIPSTTTEVENVVLAAGTYDISSAAGWNISKTTSAAFPINVYAIPADLHDLRSRAVSGIGTRVIDTGGSTTLRINASHVKVSNIEFEQTGDSGTLNLISSYASDCDILVENCLFHDTRTGGANNIAAYGTGLKAKFRNCAAWGSSRQFEGRGATSILIENCNFWLHADQLGIVTDNNTTIKNTYAGKASGSQPCFWTSGTTNGTNNASSDTSAGTMFPNSLNNVAGSDVFMSVTAGAENFKLKAGVNALKDAGITLATVTTDALGTARPQGSAYDIGAHEYAAAGPTAPGAPTIGTLTASNGSVSQAFTAPASDGGAAITGYTLTVYKASDNTVVTTATSASSPISAAVANGLAVYGKVKATNSVGTGPESAASNTVTPSVPMPAPTAARTGRTFSGSTVSYTFSTTNDPTGGDFTLTATSGPGATLGPTALTRDNVADTASVSFSGLVAGTTYVESGVVSNTGGSNNITGVGSFSVSAIDGTPIDGDSVGNAAPTFIGTLANITGTAGVAISPVNVFSLFSDTDTLTYSASPGGTAWPSGLSINPSTGVISGTIASASTTSGLKVRATDTASQTVDSNAFNVTISAVAPTVTSVVVSPSSAIITGGTIDFDAVVNGTNSPSQAVNWGADAGSIDGNGIFTPPARTFLIQTITITATSVLDPNQKGYATVVILALPIPSEGNIMAQQVDTSQLMNQSQLGARAQRALSQIIEGLIDDVAALRAGVLQQAAKLDQDAGVTDTNYSTTVAAAMGNTVVVK